MSAVKEVNRRERGAARLDRWLGGVSRRGCLCWEASGGPVEEGARPQRGPGCGCSVRVLREQRASGAVIRAIRGVGGR